MSFALDVLFASMQDAIATFFNYVFLIPLTLFNDTVIRLFTGAS